MRLFFKIKKPKLFFIVVSETHEAIISAAKFENIPTIELQHGSPAKGKINYDFSSGIKKSTFPDLFLSYGKFWNLNTLLPIDKKNIITFGYPYLQSKLEKFSNIKKENHLVVISQLVNSMELMNFAIKVSQFFKGRITVEYKPHPSEYHMLEGSHFNVLRNTGVKISAEKDDLYKIFAKSKWQVGVYSTALYEGLKFGVACFILNISGSEHMDKIISDGLARKINTIHDIDLNYKVNKKKIQMLFRKPKKKDVKKILSFARKNDF